MNTRLGAFLFVLQVLLVAALGLTVPPAHTEAQTPTEQPPEEAAEPPSTSPVEEPAPEPEPWPEDQIEANKKYLEVFGTAAFGAHELPALFTLVKKESGFNNNAQNPTSTAYGMFQFLDGTWNNKLVKAAGIVKTSDPIQQIEAGIIYIQDRYGTPSEALRFHNMSGWY